MGYRSNVYISKLGRSEKELKNLFKENNIEAVKEFEDVDTVGYAISDVKWYSGYKDVEAINSFIEEEDCEYPRGLINIGEDNATEEYGLPYETGMYAYTSINWGD